MMEKLMVPPEGDNPRKLAAWLGRFAPAVRREIRRLENKIPAPAPTTQEILAAAMDSSEFKDAMYRYIMERQKKEET